MSDKISDIQKQIDLVSKLLQELQVNLNNLKQKRNNTAIFDKFNGDTNIDEINDAVMDFTSQGAEFAFRYTGEYAFKGFYLGETAGGCHGECPWEIIVDNENTWVLKLKEIE